MSKLRRFLQQINLCGIHLWPEGDGLGYDGPEQWLTPDLLLQLKAQRTELLHYLSSSAVCPASYGQQGLWMIQQQVPQQSAYNVSIALQLRGPLNLSLLRDVIQLLVNRHEALRTRFVAQAERLVQQVDGYQPATIEELEAFGWDDAQLQGTIKQLHERPFDLAQGPLFRTTILHHGPTQHSLLLAAHHSVIDGWSVYQLVDELFTFYQDLLTGQVVKLPVLTYTYADYVTWQQQMLQQDEARLWAFWRAQLPETLPVLHLPLDHPRPPQQSLRGISHPLHLPVELTTQLTELAHQQQCTLVVLLLSAYQVLLQRYSGETTQLVGLPMSGRTRLEFEQTVGYFVSPVVLCTELTSAMTFLQVVAQVKARLLAAFDYQEYPIARLVERLNPPRDPSRSLLYQSSFVFQQAHRGQQYMQSDDNTQHTGLQVTMLPLALGAGQTDLALELFDDATELSGYFHANADILSAPTLARMAGHFITLLEAMVADPARSVAALPLLTAAERHQLLVAWNDTAVAYPQDRCIHELFADQVARTPDAVAVVFEAQQLTYAELNARANQLAHHLIGLGVGPDVLVGLCVERSLAMLVGLLGILKAGGAYVPLDPSYPAERLAFMLSDSAAPVLLTQAYMRATLPPTTAQVVCLDRDWPSIAALPTTNPVRAVQPHHLAYVIYTSGSTGRPKGTMLQHGGLINLVTAYIAELELGPDDRVLQFFAIGFDGSILDTFSALLSGASLCLVPPDRMLLGPDLVQYMCEHAVRVTMLPPVVLEALHPDDLPLLRILLSGGDSCTPTIIGRWAARRRFYNAYGPTEATVAVAWHQFTLPLVNASIPLGRPIANTRFYVTDQHNQLVPVGVAGELHIGGVQVARGYLNRPELTAERFITHPEFGRLYKTGDLVRWLPDGNIEFLGRLDQQVKLRGFRIELGEIERVLSSHSSVQACVVILREDTPGDQRLVAYVMLHEPADDLRAFLQAHLPAYMVPGHIVSLEALPLTPNGKVDRKALPALPIMPLPQDYVAPRTTLEAALVTLWQQVLDQPQVSVHANFFALGGHSLLAMRLLSLINAECAAGLTLADLFRTPTPADLATLIERNAQGQPTPATATINLATETALTSMLQLAPETPVAPSPARNILLTGATGFLGVHLLQALIEQTTARIFCLVRAANAHQAQQKLLKALHAARLPEPDASRIEALAGDLAQPHFGLTPEAWQALAGSIDALYHNGALVNLAYPYAQLKATNVDGLRQILELVATGTRKPLHYISTTSVFDGLSSEQVTEHSPLDGFAQLTIGYVQSKWIAEQLLATARTRGFPISIYRPGRLVAARSTGSSNANDFLTLLIKGCLQLGAFPDLPDAENMIAVDDAAAMIAHLSLTPHTFAEANFHIVSATNTSYVQVMAWLQELGSPLSKLPYALWYDQLVQAGAANVLAPLRALFDPAQNPPAPNRIYERRNVISVLATLPAAQGLLERRVEPELFRGSAAKGTL